MKHDIKPRLTHLRALMTRDGIDAVIIPQSDSHQSEYLADYWQVRRFFSNFTGSAGDLIVTQNEAWLWTDSRYFIQDSQQLEGTGIGLMKEGLPGTPSQEEWLKAHLHSGQKVGVDPKVYSVTSYDKLVSELATKDIVVTAFDPASVWENRPGLPSDKIFIHDVKYAGKGAVEKIDEALAAAATFGA